jgi:hypothetical protein
MPPSPRPNKRIIPDEDLHAVARETMREHFQRLRTKGKTDTRAPEEFYGFMPEEVAEIHFHKQGFGRGVWYRLKDGRVIDALGKQSEREHYWYVSSAH